MSFKQLAYMGAFLFASYLVARAFHRSRRAAEDRAFGQLIARRYPGDDLAPAVGSTGLGRIARARSAPSAYTGGR
jgi:hypothetical protein